MKMEFRELTAGLGGPIATFIVQDAVVELASALVRQGFGHENDDLGEFLGFEKTGTKMTADIDQFVQSLDAVIDFSSPSLSLQIAAKCAENRKILVCGTTGFSEEEKQKFASYAQNTVI